MKKILTMMLGATLLLGSCGTCAEDGASTGAYFGSILGAAIGGIADGPRGSDIGTIVGMAGGVVNARVRLGLRYPQAKLRAVGQSAHEYLSDKRPRKAHRILPVKLSVYHQPTMLIV